MLTTLNPGDLIPSDHPIRRIRVVVDAVLGELDDEFDAMYASSGRPSVPPEQLLKATVLMVMYSIRSERAFCERLNYDLLFKWFLGLPIDAKAFDATTFSKNRQRLLDHEIADRFFGAVVRQAKLRRRVGRRAVPQLTIDVEAPALDGAIRQQRTRMPAARRDRGSDRPSPSTGRDRTRRSDVGHQPSRHQRHRHGDTRRSDPCYDGPPNARPKSDRSYHTAAQNTTSARRRSPFAPRSRGRRPVRGNDDRVRPRRRSAGTLRPIR
jgi:transposase